MMRSFRNMSYGSGITKIGSAIRRLFDWIFVSAVVTGGSGGFGGSLTGCCIRSDMTTEVALRATNDWMPNQVRHDVGEGWYASCLHTGVPIQTTRHSERGSGSSRLLQRRWPIKHFELTSRSYNPNLLTNTNLLGYHFGGLSPPKK